MRWLPPPPGAWFRPSSVLASASTWQDMEGAGVTVAAVVVYGTGIVFMIVCNFVCTTEVTQVTEVIGSKIMKGSQPEKYKFRLLHHLVPNKNIEIPALSR